MLRIVLAAGLISLASCSVGVEESKKSKTAIENEWINRANGEPYLDQSLVELQEFPGQLFLHVDESMQSPSESLILQEGRIVKLENRYKSFCRIQAPSQIEEMTNNQYQIQSIVSSSSGIKISLAGSQTGQISVLDCFASARVGQAMDWSYAEFKLIVGGYLSIQEPR